MRPIASKRLHNPTTSPHSLLVLHNLHCCPAWIVEEQAIVLGLYLYRQVLQDRANILMPSRMPAQSALLFCGSPLLLRYDSTM